MSGAKAIDYLQQTFAESLEIKRRFIQDHASDLVRGAERMAKCVNEGGKVLIFGNGGSAADAQHMAAEMVGRMLLDRRPLPAIALTTDTSNLTAVGNDFGFDQVFLKQIQALGRSGDVAVAISTSGGSKNVLLAVEECRKRGIFVIGLTGGKGGRLKELCDLCLSASLGTNSSRIQESHIFAVHSLVDLMDRFFLGAAPN
ncbi:MAG TPA: SIS domain-containing protein [Bdellovibrionota bacterium]|jgi:D-sedoheptulose 7-phosphate isomerase|nr:SIS domain-containing protein [Bdellovibrionota bacterium]